MFSCEEVLAELSDYMDEQLSVDLRKQIEEHMVHCRNCRALYDSTRKTLRIITESGSFELSNDVSERVAERIRSKIHAKRPDFTKPSGA